MFVAACLPEVGGSAGRRDLAGAGSNAEQPVRGTEPEACCREQDQTGETPQCLGPNEDEAEKRQSNQDA